MSSGTFYDLPSTLKTHSTSFGIGEKKASYIQSSITPCPGHYEVKRIYENFERVQTVAKDTGRLLSQCTFGLPHEVYRRNMMIANVPSSATGAAIKNRNELCKTPNGAKSPVKERTEFITGETLGEDSPGPGAKYRCRSSLRERHMAFGKKDYAQASFLHDLKTHQ
jgi:hypothetical protein